MTDDLGTRTGLRCPECKRGFLYEWKEKGLVWCSKVGIYGEGVPCGYGVTSDVTRAEAEQVYYFEHKRAAFCVGCGKKVEEA